MQDVFKESFIEGFSHNDIGTKSVFLALAVTFAIGVYIFFCYKALTRKTFYSKNFNVSLVGVAMITAAIVLTIQASIVASLGMVGALSIVRFRTAIKDALDLMFLFWAISVGIICGTGFAIFAVVLSLALTVAVILLNAAPITRAPLILIINSSDINSEEAIMETVHKYAKYSVVKCRNMTADSLDMTLELRTNNGCELIRELVSKEGVVSANLLSHDGEVNY